MGGQAGLRGYIVQTLIAIIDSLDSSNEWETVTIESNEESEKVDIVWRFSDNSKEVVQVKSTKNDFSYANAEKWINELKEETLDAKKYVLYLVGDLQKKLKKKINEEINGAIIKHRALDMEGLNSSITEKIDEFLSKKNKPKIEHALRVRIASNIKNDFIENSILGKELTKVQLEEALLFFFDEIESYLKNTPYSVLLNGDLKSNTEVENKYLFALHLQNLIGWKDFNFAETVSEYNEKTDSNDEYTIDFCGFKTSRLKDNGSDFIYIQSMVLDNYSNMGKNVVKSFCYSLNKVSEVFEKNQNSNKTNISKHSIHFFISLDEEENNTSIIHLINPGYNYANLKNNITYYGLDNKQLNFLMRSIIYAKNYREDCSTKFLYPITEDNMSESKIGKRDIYLPPQYINSSILPIIKENKDKISVLVFCNDTFNKRNLNKVVWLTVALTSGMANEYKLFFPDFTEVKSNEVNDTLRTFKDELLEDKISVYPLEDVIIRNLKSVSLTEEKSSTKNHKVEEANLEGVNYIPNNDFLDNYLPYGSLIKPFLSSEQIKSEDLKQFLEEKGIFIKSQDKNVIVELMTKLLFSPSEIELLTKHIRLKKSTPTIITKPPYSTTKEIKSIVLLDTVQKAMIVGRKQLENEVIKKNSIISHFDTKIENDKIEVIVIIEETDPNKQAMISKSSTPIKITLKNDGTKIEAIQEFQSKLGRKTSKTLLNLIEKQLKEENKITEITKDIMFSDFDSNEERIKFLYSFMELDDHLVFKSTNLKLSRYAFDESKEIPNDLSDKIGVKLRTAISGEDISEVKELKDEDYRKFVLLEKVNIAIDFNYQGAKGKLYVDIDFSGALKNELNIDGILSFKLNIYPNSKHKKLIKNLAAFENNLKEEFSVFKKSKLKKFNLI